MLRLEDHLQPGIVEWARVHKQPKHIYERVENCNFAIEVAKRLRMTVVGIDGNDLAQGSRKLTLAILWQLMRADLLAFLAQLGISDRDVIRWANLRVRGSGSRLQIKKPSDVTLRNGVYLLQLEHAVAPECVSADEMLDGSTALECKLNAKYAVSCSHKMGCRVFLTWEDILEVKPRAMLTLLAAIMAIDMKRRQIDREEVLKEVQQAEPEAAPPPSDAGVLSEATPHREQAEHWRTEPLLECENGDGASPKPIGAEQAANRSREGWLRRWLRYLSCGLMPAPRGSGARAKQQRRPGGRASTSRASAKRPPSRRDRRKSLALKERRRSLVESAVQRTQSVAVQRAHSGAVGQRAPSVAPADAVEISVLGLGAVQPPPPPPASSTLDALAIRRRSSSHSRRRSSRRYVELDDQSGSVALHGPTEWV